MIKKRNPWFVFFMIILTIGIYFFVWVYKTNNELLEEYNSGPKTIIIVLLFLIPIVSWAVLLKWLNHIKKYQEHMNYESTIKILPLFLLALVLNPISCALVQKSLNNKP